MPLVLRFGAAASALLLLVGDAWAQRVGTDRFFSDRVEDEEDLESTTYGGSFTSTTFYYREDGDPAPPPTDGNAEPFSASPVDRIFTDLRSQLSAKHISGSKVDFRSDVRFRLNTTTYTSTSGASADDDPTTEVPYQSGTRYGNEFDVREFYAVRRGSSFDLSVGRQYALDLAGTKFDGVKLEGTGRSFRPLLFGGLYPSRISRDLRDDYPAADADPATAGYQDGGSPVLPVTAGAGLGYRFPSAYGAFGAVGILPLADDVETGVAEKSRIFLTANGYWRQSSILDFYHYLVVDAAGTNTGLTNLTLGVNLQPTPSLRAYATVSRIDTDVLNVIAQTQLQDPDSMPGENVGNTVQNNVAVQRIAQDSVRVGLSANLRERFEVSTSGAVRRRGELRFEFPNGDPDDPTDDAVFGAAQAADITIAAVDRKSLADMRLGLSVTRTFGVGNVNLHRNQATIARLDATKELGSSAEFEGSLAYVSSADDNRGQDCDAGSGTVEKCYGASEVQSISLGGLLFYRVSSSWFVVGNINLGAQMSKSADIDGALNDQPTILTTALLLRLAYRF